MQRGWRALVGSTLAMVVLCLGPPGSEAQTCTVPDQVPSIAAALADPACETIVLGAQSYPESVVVSRSVTIQGVSSDATVIEGQVQVVAGTVALDHLRVDTSSAALAGRFHQALVVEAGARLSGTDLRVVHKALLFGDGFESGNTTAWSQTSP